MVIELNGVKFAHPEAPDNTVLDISHWSVDKGEHIFVYGPSGSGKSTLLNLISGLHQAAQGEVQVLGERLDQMSNRQRDRFRAHHVGYVFQRFNLIPYLNAIENIELAKSFAKQSKKSGSHMTAEALLESLNVASHEWHRPTSQLSMGQQQRVAIARALINRPEIVIADEPTSSLDEENRDNFIAVLMALLNAQDMTLLFVSHDRSLARHFQRVQALTEFSRVA